MADVNFNGFPVTETVPSTDLLLVGNASNGVRNATKANFLKEITEDITFNGSEITVASGLSISIRRCMVSPKACFIALGFTANSAKQAYDKLITDLPFNIGTSEYFPIMDITDGSTKWAYGYEHDITLRSALTAGHVYAFSHYFV